MFRANEIATFLTMYYPIAIFVELLKFIIGKPHHTNPYSDGVK